MARVMKTFVDRKSKKLYRAGDDYAGGDERIAELAAGGYVVAPKRKKKDEPKEEIKDEPVEIADSEPVTE